MRRVISLKNILIGVAILIVGLATFIMARLTLSEDIATLFEIFFHLTILACVFFIAITSSISISPEGMITFKNTFTRPESQGAIGPLMSQEDYEIHVARIVSCEIVKLDTYERGGKAILPKTYLKINTQDGYAKYICINKFFKGQLNSLLVFCNTSKY